MSVKKLKYLASVGTMLGILLVSVGIVMARLEAGTIFPNPKSAPWGFVLIGLLLIIVTIAPYFDEQKKTQRERIEEQDERNQSIFYQSGCYAYRFLMGVGTLVLLFLTMLGYMNKVSFFSLAGIFIVSSLLQLGYKYYLNQKW